MPIMLPNRPISEYLPIRFANGEQVRQFSKPCVQCGHMLNAKHMHGVARLFKAHVAIAAKAHCPACNKEFAVTCLIDDGKRVQRVVVPYWLFNPYLRVLKPLPDEVDAQSGSMPEPVPAVSVASTPLSLQKAEEVVGRYQGNPIPAWVRVEGQLFTFDRVVQDKQVAQGEFLLDGCLVYRLSRENC
jgi:hypothetical protein